MRVDLPAPFSPSSARICPRCSVTEMWSTASVSPKLLQRSRSSNSGEEGEHSERTISRHFPGAEHVRLRAIIALVSRLAQRLKLAPFSPKVRFRCQINNHLILQNAAAAVTSGKYETEGASRLIPSFRLKIIVDVQSLR